MLTQRQIDLIRSAIVYHGIFKNELAAACKAGEGSDGWRHFEARRDWFLKELGISSLYGDDDEELNFQNEKALKMAQEGR